jgi:hypothetical protein
MIELTCNLWDVPADWKGITTNGYVKGSGECVMGRGCAKEASQRYPTLPRKLGQRLKLFGNVVHMFPEYGLFSFPVKHAWYQDADPVLIAASARQLRRLAEDAPQEMFVLPRPGCGNGHLDWAVVRPLLLSLPDNVFVITL